MSTIQQYSRSQIKRQNPMASPLRTIVRTAFYGNNVTQVKSLAEAYYLAKNSAGTIETDLPIYKPETMGLPSNARVLLYNCGSITGRTAAARRIAGDENVDSGDLNKKIMQDIYQARRKKLYAAEAIVGLDEDFMIRAHLLVPEGDENILYNWLLNFQPLTAEYAERYAHSRVIPDEGDVYVYSDSQWSHPEHPLGLTYFDPQHNCAAILGLPYFGEYKKGTLTLAWAIANRHGFATCHGGQKEITRPDGSRYVLSVFGLSGSGKSSITHAKHQGRYQIKVLHDDAFIINLQDKYSIAMEPTYFDKTQDYPTDSPDNKYLLSVQNCGATLDEDGKVVLVTEDIRNGNGRAIKSRLWSPSRVDRIDSAVNAIAWIMKDPCLPPLVKVNDPEIASLMGATLATKRSSAERLAQGVDSQALVIEPYANPFRTYPLADDFQKFKTLFATGVDCYILNTGYFGEKKVRKEDTLAAIESVVDGTVQWDKFTPVEGFEYAKIDGFLPQLEQADYVQTIRDAFSRRYEYIGKLDSFNHLPESAQAHFLELVRKIRA